MIIHSANQAFWNTTRNLKWLGFVIVIVWIHTVDFGSLPGKIFPAAEPMKLTRIYDGPKIAINGEIQPSVIFWGESARLRSLCEPLRMEWFKGQRNGRRVPLDTWRWGRPVINPDGAFAFGPWSITGITADEFENAAFGDVIHQCSIFRIKQKGKRPAREIRLPWQTRSPFWK